MEHEVFKLALVIALVVQLAPVNLKFVFKYPSKIKKRDLENIETLEKTSIGQSVNRFTVLLRFSVGLLYRLLPPEMFPYRDPDGT
ncbi:hypothetical protein AB204_11195 [Xenorhabdus khoisanae]|uniref:Uncharacterized protein n=1 Tax=Xenorhabdus khoisanae TaxID=880157 RepID=A0A0J5FSZ5_9GAMM|nr:hypothetical protein AB204_11195 [Xenorhabdus khoisanae]